MLGHAITTARAEPGLLHSGAPAARGQRVTEHRRLDTLAVTLRDVPLMIEPWHRTARTSYLSLDDSEQSL